MTEPLIVLAGLVLLVLVLLWQRRDSWPQRPRQRPEVLTSCAWCVHRAGDDCTHPASPVSGEPCGPVCVGDLACPVREVDRLGEGFARLLADME